MKIKYIPLKKLLAIKSNGYVGEHDRKGKQVDYADYQSEIDSRIHELTDKKLFPVISQYGYRAEIETEEFQVGIQDYVNKAFNSWRYLADNIEMRLL